MDDRAPRPTRRRLLRLLAGAAAALVPALGPGEAGAFRRWCRVDPVFRIAGQTAHVFVAARVRSMRQARELATGPTALRLAVPAGVEARLLACDDGFGWGYDVVVEEAADLGGAGPVIPVRVSVTVPMAAGDIRVRAAFVPAGAAAGAGPAPASDGEGAGGGAGAAPADPLRAGGGEGTANAEIAFVAA